MSLLELEGKTTSQKKLKDTTPYIAHSIHTRTNPKLSTKDPMLLANEVIIKNLLSNNYQI